MVVVVAAKVTRLQNSAAIVSAGWALDLATLLRGKKYFIRHVTYSALFKYTDVPVEKPFHSFKNKFYYEKQS